jgi:hypothetical protein
MTDENIKKSNQLKNLLDKPVWFLQLETLKKDVNGDDYVSEERRFLTGMTDTQALEEARKVLYSRRYDAVHLCRMRAVVDNIAIR